ncbi:hypothetical protein QVD17_31721 [Tagetes erecta]|uniref:Dof-type domain-containing protein n=1 Tax=Tagetes erecta TaxID=13708 RepID=A0AAD8K4S4_TARER|nr:hypothetical protein QVD17_31721 [Tagetes erecta]
MPEVKDPEIKLKLFGKTIQLSNLDQEYCSNDIKKTIESDNPIGDSNPEEKPQKPEKILPCPRCSSMDTKFCYYNNYNVNQPRHFCKNCQRYWTAGGTMRNTPVGSGRRKNKSLNSASYYRHLIVTDSGLKTNGSVLNFGSDVQLCESMNQALNFTDKLPKSDDNSSISASNSIENGGNNGLMMMNLPKYPVQIPCFSSNPLCYPANLYWSMPMQLMNTNSALGKHSRDGILLPAFSNSGSLKDQDLEATRVNDPNKVAKSSLWDENGNNVINGGIFCKAFKSKTDESNEVVGGSLANLYANPAALSRSLNFREMS